MSNPPLSDGLDQGKLLAMQIMLCGRMEELFAELGVSATRTRKMYVGPCPIHGGDNPLALNVYFGGESVPGFWRCHSRHCERAFKKTIIGFVRGVLSRSQFGWNGATSKRTVTFDKTIDWCCKFLGTRFKDLKIDEKELERLAHARHIDSIVKKIEQERKGISRAQCISRLNIPAEYFIKRGWSREVLAKFDVGTPKETSSPMAGRVVVPIYDELGEHLVGVTARSIHEKCDNCKMWHPPKSICPATEDWMNHSKWKNSPGFQRETCLYNYWHARGHIKRTGTVVLVEGPGEVWRLFEAGIDVGLALLGTGLSDQQQVILEKSGAMNVLLVMNDDEPGRDATEQIRDQLRRSFRIYTPKLPASDLGESSPAEVRGAIQPLLEELAKKWV